MWLLSTKIPRKKVVNFFFRNIVFIINETGSNLFCPRFKMIFFTCHGVNQEKRWRHNAYETLRVSMRTRTVLGYRKYRMFKQIHTLHVQGFFLWNTIFLRRYKKLYMTDSEQISSHIYLIDFTLSIQCKNCLMHLKKKI